MPDTPATHRGIQIRQFDVPCTPFVWTHDETDGHGMAETLDRARTQIDRHLDQLARQPISDRQLRNQVIGRAAATASAFVPPADYVEDWAGAPEDRWVKGEGA